MSEYKIAGSTDPVTTEAGNLTEGIGFPLRPVDTGGAAGTSPVYGALYWSTPAATTDINGVAAKAAGTTTSQELSDFTMPADNRLTYTGTDTQVFECHAALSVSTSQATTMTMYLYKNGVAVAGSEIDRKTSSNDVGAAVVSSLIELATDDYIELWVECSGTQSVTIQHRTLIATVVA